MKYFIADLHNYDHNLIVYENRPFADCETMRNEMINRWNETVNDSDEIFLLGDIGNPEILLELKGKITIVLGNHDNYDNIINVVGGRQDIEISRYPILVDACLLSHEPLTFMPPECPYLNIHGHTHRFSYGLLNRKWEDGNRYFCVSVEQINYTPISQKEIVDIIGYVNYSERKRKEKGS